VRPAVALEQVEQLPDRAVDSPGDRQAGEQPLLEAQERRAAQPLGRHAGADDERHGHDGAEDRGRRRTDLAADDGLKERGDRTGEQRRGDPEQQPEDVHGQGGRQEDHHAREKGALAVRPPPLQRWTHHRSPAAYGLAMVRPCSRASHRSRSLRAHRRSITMPAKTTP
jgi:hypothetical protein